MAITFLLLLAAAAPLSEDPSFLEAQRLYNEVELEQAALRFQALLDVERPPEEAARLYSWHGLTLAQLGRSEGARASFDAAVALVPDVALPAPAPPKIEALLADAKAAAAAQRELATAPQPAPDEVAEAPRAEEAEPGSAPVPWLLVTGGGVAALGAGVALGGVALALISLDVEQQAYAAAFASEANALADTADLQRGLGIGLMVAGVVVVGGGAALAFVPTE